MKPIEIKTSDGQTTKITPKLCLMSGYRCSDNRAPTPEEQINLNKYNSTITKCPSCAHYYWAQWMGNSYFNQCRDCFDPNSETL